MQDRRSRERVRASFVLRVLPEEARVRVRSGDISRTGLFVELDQDVGAPGDLKRIRLGSRDALHVIELDARIIRVVRSDDLLEGRRVVGVAFELVLPDATLQDRVDALVEHLNPAFDPAEAPAGVRVRLETPWQMRAGERVSVEVPTAEGGRVRVEARALDSRPRKNGSYATRFDLERCEEHGDREVTGIRLAIARRRPDLAGELASLSLPTLLAVASMEQLTGLLRLTDGVDEARVFLRRGQVVDVEGFGLDPRPALARALEWSHGTFALDLRDVTCPDRVQTPTTALLLDLAREQDEREREVA